MPVIKHYIHLQPTASLCNRLFITLTLSNVNSRLVSVRKILRSSRNLNTFCNLLILKKEILLLLKHYWGCILFFFATFQYYRSVEFFFDRGAPEGKRYHIHKGKIDQSVMLGRHCSLFSKSTF